MESEALEICPYNHHHASRSDFSTTWHRAGKRTPRKPEMASCKHACHAVLMTKPKPEAARVNRSRTKEGDSLSPLKISFPSAEQNGSAPPVSPSSPTLKSGTLTTLTAIPCLSLGFLFPKSLFVKMTQSERGPPSSPLPPPRRYCNQESKPPAAERSRRPPKCMKGEAPARMKGMRGKLHWDRFFFFFT